MAGNPGYPGSQFPGQVDQITSQPDREIPDAIMSMQASLLGVAGAQPLPQPANISTGTVTASGAVTGATGAFAGGVTTGNVQFTAPGSALRSGSGAPGSGMGNVGDYYFRSDTPGTANQRIYVKTGASTWTGIL